MGVSVVVVVVCRVVEVVVVVEVEEVEVGEVIGILSSSVVGWGVEAEVAREDFRVSLSSCSSSKPSGGSGIRVSHSWSLLPCRNQAGRGRLVVEEVRGTQP